MRNAVTELLRQKLSVIDVAQNSPEWFDLRKTKRTASETPIIMGLSPWSSPSKLAVEKFGNKPVAPLDNPAVRHGHRYESKARSYFEHVHDIKMPAHVLVRGDYLSSLDGWNRKENEILEIKCPFTYNESDTWVKACDDEVPDHYMAQIQHQLMVSGARLCHFWVFDTRRIKGIRVIVDPDPKYWVRILAAWDLFVKRYS